ncbi:MAG: ATP-binding cassette domain-containing protein [Isosphaeraceae bacterium]
MIQVEGVYKRFLDYQRGWVTAIADISFECEPGAIFGLLGPNGAGKTTTLRILSTVLRPTRGRAIVAGHDVLTDPQAVRSSIGYMSATTGIYERMTAWEMVEYFGRLYGIAPHALKPRMETIFDWLQMNDFRDVLGSKMSTGMKQKVSIARTIVHDPPVLIFDEPTTGLDVLVARAVLQKIIELRDMGKTILFSTHAMHEVARLCSKVAIIHKGRLQAAGAPRELLARFDQPDLEELFFYLVELAESRSGGAECGPASANEHNGQVDWS